MDTIEIFKERIEKKRKQFPNGFWEGEDGRARARIITRYVLEQIYGLKEGDSLKNIRYSTFVKLGLGNMLRVLYSDVLYDAINDAYPNKYYPWELACVPMGYWEKKENRRFAVNWLRNEFNWSEYDLVKNITVEIIRQKGLIGLLSYYNDRLYNFTRDNVDIEFVQWEMKRVGKSFWLEKENAIQAMHWLINKYNWSEKDFLENLSTVVMTENNLRGLLCCRYGGNIYD